MTRAVRTGESPDLQRLRRPRGMSPVMQRFLAETPPDQLMALLKLMASQDPVTAYAPGPAQERCYQSTAPFRWIGGRNRGGKSQHLATEAAAYLRGLHWTRPRDFGPVHGALLAPSRSQLSDPWTKKMVISSELPGELGQRPLIPFEEIKDVRFDTSSGLKYARVIEMHDGSSLDFFVSGDEHVWERMQGKRLDFAIVDEGAGSEELLEELYFRLVDSQSDALRVHAGWMLWGATRTAEWPALEKFIDLCMSEEKEHDAWEGFVIKPGENPAISEDVMNVVRHGIRPEAAAARIDGDVGMVNSLLVYPQFSDDRHCDFNSDYRPSPRANIWASYDPGSAHSTGLLLAGIEPDHPKRINVYAYYDKKRATAKEDAAWLRHALKGRTLEGFVYDPACHASRKEGAGVSMLTLIQRAVREEGIVPRRGFIAGYNRHEPGFEAVRQALDRNDLLLHMKGEGMALARTQLRSYRKNKDTASNQGKVRKKDDEFPDVLRYLVMATPAWVDRGAEGVARDQLPLERQRELASEEIWKRSQADQKRKPPRSRFHRG